MFDGVNAEQPANARAVPTHRSIIIVPNLCPLYELGLRDRAQGVSAGVFTGLNFTRRHRPALIHPADWMPEACGRSAEPPGTAAPGHRRGGLVARAGDANGRGRGGEPHSSIALAHGAHVREAFDGG